MKFIETVFSKLQRHPKRIVFPEGGEPRVLHAAAEMVKRKISAPILLGNRDEIRRTAEAEGVDLHYVGLLDPARAEDLPLFCQRLTRLQRYRHLDAAEAVGFLSNPNYFAAMMVQHGQADGIVGGIESYAGSLLRPLFQLVKPLPDAPFISGCMVMIVNGRLLLLADCGVVPEPTLQQLAQIGVQTGKLCAQLTGERPRIAYLSFSTKGSATHPSAQKMNAAAMLARQLAESAEMDMEIDGELQADTALLPDLARRKAPQSLVAGQANVLIFPDLNSANIAAKLIEHLAGAETYGQILLGLSKPSANISRGSCVQTIVGTAAIVGLQTVEYRKLYPIASQADDEGV